MLITGFPAGATATNCYVVATGEGAECVVVDPGINAHRIISGLMARHRLKPVAVLLTHGHFDHTFSVRPVCDGYGIPALLHPRDRSQLTDPWTPVGIPFGTPLFGKTEFSEPSAVRDLVDGERLDLAGVVLTVRGAPGHTPGSVVFNLETQDIGTRGITLAEVGPAQGAGATTLEGPVMFSGDLLFAGSIGRVDFPGGSEQEIFQSLARVVLPADDATLVLPGHGPRTTVGQERHSNPYLQLAGIAGDGFPSGVVPTRGAM